MSLLLFHLRFFFDFMYLKKIVKILNIIFLNVPCNKSKIYEWQCVKALFPNIMRFISPLYDENSRRSTDFNYENVNVAKLRIKKNLAPSPLLPQRQGDCLHGVGVSQGATLHILAQLHRRLAKLSLKFWSPLFFIFLLFILGKI